MAYAPLDEHFDEHPKYEPLELEHYGLMACAITYCNRNLTDGKVSFKAVRGFGNSGKGPKYAKKLTEAGIWRDVETGWEIVGYLDHNPSRAEVLAKREAARARKDAYRKGMSPPPVPLGQPVGQDAGHGAGQDAGRPPGQDAGQKGQSLARAPVPAGGIRSAALHGTTIQKIPEPVLAAGTTEKPRLSAFEEPFWKTAYGESVRSSLRGSWSFPDRQARSIRSAIEGHCNDYADIDAWLRGRVAAFVEATRDRSTYYAGLGPDGFLKWLNEESAKAPAIVAAPPPAEPERHYPPPTPEEAAKLEQDLRDLVDPSKRPGRDVGTARAIGEDLSRDDLERLDAKRRETIARLKADLEVGDARGAR